MYTRHVLRGRYSDVDIDARDLQCDAQAIQLIGCACEGRSNAQAEQKHRDGPQIQH